MEHFGEWSAGKHTDPRLEGGYENVPTVDVHMRQVGWEEHWMQVLQKYVYPIQLKLWEGYYDKVSVEFAAVIRAQYLQRLEGRSITALLGCVSYLNFHTLIYISFFGLLE